MLSTQARNSNWEPRHEEILLNLEGNRAKMGYIVDAFNDEVTKKNTELEADSKLLEIEYNAKLAKYNATPSGRGRGFKPKEPNELETY
jgi:hypothetical protein